MEKRMKFTEPKSPLLKNGSHRNGRHHSLFPSLFASIAILGLGGLTTQVAGEVRLPKVFGSHMVLQQEKPLTFWGWAQPNETVTVRLLEESKQVQANERGEWKAVLSAKKAGGPCTVTVTGSLIRKQPILPFPHP